MVSCLASNLLANRKGADMTMNKHTRERVADRAEVIPVFPHALGVALVPQPRPIGRGGFADLMADWRHRRRLSRHYDNAA